VWPRGWVEVQFYSSMTAALEGCEWSAARPGRTLPPGKARYPFYRGMGGPQGHSGRAENLVPTSIQSRTVQQVAQSLYRLSYRPTQTYLLQFLTHNKKLDSCYGMLTCKCHLICFTYLNTDARHTTSSHLFNFKEGQNALTYTNETRNLLHTGHMPDIPQVSFHTPFLLVTEYQ